MAGTLTLRRSTKRAGIKHALSSLIEAQGLRRGERLPGQVELASHFDTTVVTMHRALKEMESEGLLHRVVGKGTFVGPDPASQKTLSMCLVLPGEHLDQREYNPDYWPYVQGMLTSFVEAAGNTWRFSTQAIDPATSTEEAEARLAGLDAVFFHYSKEPVDLWRHLVQRHAMPVVAFGLRDPDVPGFTINEDTRIRATMALSYLRELGYRCIVPVASVHPWGELWLDEYRKAARQVGLPGRLARALRVGESPPETGREVERLRAEVPTCDALLVDTDTHALNILSALADAGVSVPDDIGVMGLSGLTLMNRHPPHLTSVATAYPDMIRFCLKQVEKAGGQPLPPQHIDFGGEIAPGRTTRSPANRSGMRVEAEAKAQPAAARRKAAAAAVGPPPPKPATRIPAAAGAAARTKALPADRGL